MRVALIAPNPGAHTVVPPLGLGYLAATLMRQGHEVTIVDLAKESWSAREGAKATAVWEPDLVGISVLSTAFLSAKEFLAELGRICSAPIVAGGPHITAVPQSIMDLDAGMGMIGESEEIFPRLVGRMDRGASLDGLPGVCRKDGGEVVTTERPGFSHDLDALDFPAWELMRPGTYPDMPHQLLHKDYPVAPVLTSRGCPYDCSFCASTTLWGRRLRTRSARNVVDEIELLVGEYGVREIHFEDDNFTQKPGHARMVCEEILRRDIRISWACPNGVRIDTLDDGLLDLMKASGCHALGLGLESGSQRVLDQNGKRLDLGRVPSLVKMIKSHGISTHGFFIIGLPGEDEESARETLGFALTCDLDRANFSLLAPLPGTQIFERHVMGGRGMEEIDYGVLNFFTAFPIGELSARRLKGLQRRAVFRFYLRPRQIMHLALHLKPSQIGKIVKALLDYSR